jgi:hypothetical protein
MITGNAKTLEWYRETSDGGRLVSIPLGLGNYADDYRGYTIAQYLWQGEGPAGGWFWQAQNGTDLIGETHLCFGSELDVRTEIIFDAMSAIDSMLDDPEWAESVRTATPADA